MFLNTPVKNHHLPVNSAHTTTYSAISAKFPRKVACKTDELIYILRCDVFFGRRSRLFSTIR